MVKGVRGGSMGVKDSLQESYLESQNNPVCSGIKMP